MMQNQNIILLAAASPWGLLLFGIVMVIGGILMTLFFYFGDIARPDARGSISIKRHLRVIMYDLLGPKVLRWSYIGNGIFMSFLGAGLTIAGGIGLSRQSARAYPHYPPQARRSSQVRQHSTTNGRVSSSPKADVSSKNLTRIVITDALGHMEGTAFQEFAPKGAVLVGIQVSCTSDKKISSIQLLFRDKDGSYIKGKIYGIETDQKKYTVAKDGYAISGVQARVGALFNGIRVIYMKVTGDRLDFKQQYKSPWLGENHSEKWEEIQSKGTPFVAIRGACQGEIVGLECLEKSQLINHL